MYLTEECWTTASTSPEMRQCRLGVEWMRRLRTIAGATLALSVLLLPAHAVAERIDRNFKPMATQGKRTPAVPLVDLKISKGELAVQINYRERLETLTVQPPGKGPFPLAVISHGVPTKGGNTARLRLRNYLGVAEDLARRGYKAVIFARRGYASSTGKASEGYGGCSNANKWSFTEAAEAGARDYAAVIEALVEQPDVDGKTVIVAGQSGGGFAASALAMNAPAGLMGILNFSGGRGGAKEGNCSEDGYVGAFGNFGANAKVPALWLYSTTDKLFWPELVDKALEAYIANGAPVRLDRFGRLWYSSNGHALYRAGGRELWGPAVTAFLNDIGAPNWAETPMDANVEKPEAPWRLSRRGRRSWLSYLSRSRHKAYAYDEETRAYGWTTVRDTVEAAKERALKNCRKSGDDCKIMNVDGKMVSQ